MLSLAVVSQAWADEPFRSFRNRKGKVLEARLVEVKGDSVVLEKRDGSRFSYEIPNLSREDQDYVREIQANGGPKNSSDRSNRVSPGGADESKFSREKLFAFEGVGNYRKKETDHFDIRIKARSFDPARSYAEKVWEVGLPFLPDLKQRFENKGFRAPRKKQGNANDFSPVDGRFRYRVYLVDDESRFRALVEQYGQEAYRDKFEQEKFEKGAMEVGVFDDFQNRFMVMLIADAARGDDRPVFVHGLGANLVKEECEETYLPLWIMAGFGYYFEHQIFKKCRTRYIDFVGYYNKIEGKKESEIFKKDSSWVPVVKQIAKREEDRASLHRLFGVTVTSLTPELSGYLFAFASFLVSEEANAAKFQKVIAAVRKGEKLSPSLVSEAYGYPSAAALEEAFYAFIKSGKFK